MFERKCDYIYIIKGYSVDHIPPPRPNSSVLIISDNNLPPMCATHNNVPLPVFCEDNLR